MKNKNYWYVMRGHIYLCGEARELRDVKTKDEWFKSCPDLTHCPRATNVKLKVSITHMQQFFLVNKHCWYFLVIGKHTCFGISASQLSYVHWPHPSWTIKRKRKGTEKDKEWKEVQERQISLTDPSLKNRVRK